MYTASVEEAQARLPELLDRAESGEEIVITRDGRPVARLTRPELPKGVPIYGRGKGKLIINPDVPDDAYLKDFEDYL